MILLWKPRRRNICENKSLLLTGSFARLFSFFNSLRCFIKTHKARLYSWRVCPKIQSSLETSAQYQYVDYQSWSSMISTCPPLPQGRLVPMAPPENPSAGKEMRTAPNIVLGNPLAVTSAPVKVMPVIVLCVSNPAAALRARRKEVLHNIIEPLIMDLITADHSLPDQSNPDHSNPDHLGTEVLCTEPLIPEPPAPCP
jgi:hypothetical protein